METEKFYRLTLVLAGVLIMFTSFDVLAAVCAHAISGDKCFTENELVPLHWRPLDE